MTISKPLKLTDAGSIPAWQLDRTQPGMAHFAGTGPDGQVCGGCLHWQSIPRGSKMHCAKYVDLTGDRKLKPVLSSTWACRHWVKR